jgi:hypothetical protein
VKARLQPPLIQCPETSSDVQDKLLFAGVS